MSVSSQAQRANGVPHAEARDDIRCQRCWKRITDPEYFVTACGHAFCLLDAQNWFAHKNDCPACQRLLTLRDLRKVCLNPSPSELHMLMWGWPPETVLNCAKSAVSAWNHMYRAQLQWQSMQGEARADHASAEASKTGERLRHAMRSVDELKARLNEEASRSRQLAKQCAQLDEERKEAERKCRNFEQLYQQTRRSGGGGGSSSGGRAAAMTSSPRTASSMSGSGGGGGGSSVAASHRPLFSGRAAPPSPLRTPRGGGPVSPFGSPHGPPQRRRYSAVPAGSATPSPAPSHAGRGSGQLPQRSASVAVGGGRAGRRFAADSRGAGPSPGNAAGRAGVRPLTSPVRHHGGRGSTDTRERLFARLDAATSSTAPPAAGGAAVTPSRGHTPTPGGTPRRLDIPFGFELFARRQA